MEGCPYSEKYFNKNPAHWLEHAFRSSYFASLNPVFSDYPEIKKGIGKKALDVGCGRGFGVKILSEFRYDVYGLDISFSAINYAKKHFSGTFFVHDIHDPIPHKEKFDLIQCIDVIEHLKYPEKALKNIYEPLKNGGFLILTTPNKYSPYTILFDKDETHINVKSVKEWISILNKFDWRIMKIYFRQYIPLSYKLFRRFIFINLKFAGNKLIFLLRK